MESTQIKPFDGKNPAGTFELVNIAWSEAPRWIATNTPNMHEASARWHYAILRASLGQKGTLFGLYFVAACGAKLGSAWGNTVTEDQPAGDAICARCARLKVIPDHITAETN